MQTCDKCHEREVLNAESLPSLKDEPWGRQLPWGGDRRVDF